MKVLSEDYGYTLIFKNAGELDNMVSLLRDGLNEYKKEETKPPYLITFYTSDGVSSEFVKKHMLEIKKNYAK